MSDIPFLPATEIARYLRERKLSAVEVTQAFIAQVERTNPKVNAIVTFLPEQALEEARRIDAMPVEARGPLAGLPIAFKDVVPTKGIRTTFGSPIYRDHVPAEDHAMVERVKAAGAITLGKTNTPEFAAGSQTFNAVFGLMWFLGSALMGLVYDHSIGALVAFGVAAQLAAALAFFLLRAPLAAQALK